MIQSKTYGEQFREALACETREQAGEWFAKEAARISLLTDKSLPECEDILRQNLGYMAGYYDDATVVRIQTLFRRVPKDGAAR